MTPATAQHAAAAEALGIPPDLWAAGIAIAIASTREQGIPEFVDDAGTIARVAALIRPTPDMTPHRPAVHAAEDGAAPRPAPGFSLPLNPGPGPSR